MHGRERQAARHDVPVEQKAHDLTYLVIRPTEDHRLLRLIDGDLRVREILQDRLDAIRRRRDEGHAPQVGKPWIDAETSP